MKVSRTGAESALSFGPEEERMKSRLEALEASFNKPQGIKVLNMILAVLTASEKNIISNKC